MRGEHPQRFSGRSTISTILIACAFIRRRRVLPTSRWSRWATARRQGSRLADHQPKEGFEEPRVTSPKRFEHGGETFEFRDKKYADGKLTLMTSEVPSRGWEISGLNSIDILAKSDAWLLQDERVGLMRFAPESEFILVSECPMLEDKDRDCVRNDREKLVERADERA